ncbi:MAG: T9SS type A sorting domain-containing protein [Flavobacteriaceae bacterium]|nr:MAG: T9SS type A sorting domain-containing protein [Flavobacteriaceae bacterium]TXI68411.1 MAG: T9SS type A sorting domain-containing protein [Flavobacterium sp.]
MKKTIASLVLFFSFISFSQSVDTNFQLGINGFNSTSEIRKTIIQPDGKILILGNYLNYNGLGNFGKLMRLNSNGTFDAIFMNNLGTGFDRADHIELLPDGKILVSESSECIPYLNGAAVHHLVRLNPDGTIDNTFNLNFTGTNYQNTYKNQTFHPNGKIYVIHKTNKLIRLNSNGTTDTSFAPRTIDHIGSFPNFPNVFFIKIDPNGKLLIGGQINTYDNNTTNNLIRINEDGTLDNTFNLPFSCSGNNQYVYSLDFIENSKILVTARIPSSSGTVIGTVLRLNSDWSIDNTFNYFEASSTKFLLRTVVQPDNKILVSGYNTSTTNGNTCYFKRLNSDGSYSDFNVSGVFSLNNTNNSNVDTYISEMFYLADGKILVTGNFNYCQGQQKRKIVRLNNQTLSIDEFDKVNIRSYPNPVNDILKFECKEKILKIEVYDYEGRILSSNSISENKINLSDLKTGNYILKLYTEKGIMNTKIIKE